MKYFNRLSCLLAMVLLFCKLADANWIKPEVSNNYSAREIKSENAAIVTSDNSDSLPEGVTQDWLNRLRDENGNPIMPEKRSGPSEEDPEGDAMQRGIFEGPAAESYFGGSVSSAGDVNGDGYDDVIVGASGFSSATGRVFIYYGGLNMNTEADKFGIWNFEIGICFIEDL